MSDLHAREGSFVAEDAREEFRSWLRDNWVESLTLREWWRRLGESGWAFPGWPAQWYGRGMPAHGVHLVRAEIRQAGAIGAPFSFGQGMGAPTLIERGNDDQRRRWLGPLAKGLEAWCQFFSEPSAGSDLAALRTTARREGDEWIVNGQKVWTSFAHRSDRGMLLARTNPNVPKHAGITYFIIEIDQPGIEIRPLRQMNGETEFNEVFFTDARVADSDVVGSVDDGWAVAVTTLAHERQSIGAGTGADDTLRPPPGERGGILDVPVGEILAKAHVADAGKQRGASRNAHTSFGLVRKYGRHADPVVRQALAAFFAREETARLSALRAQESIAAGRPVGPEGSTGKLAAGEHAHESRDLDVGILGPVALLAGKDSPEPAVLRNSLSAHEISIGGGSSEIQKNIIGERVLGLPREPRPDRDVPFRDLMA